ncbi:MAG: hypothetical protein O3C34_17800 [Proteobacteria bacterium]|nr:hypothetical protein [Pseudomonadota bacterium]
MSLRRLWMGDLPLEQAFWSYAVIGGIAVNVLTSVVFLVLITMDMTVAALIAGYVLSVPYNVAATVGVWRAAARDGSESQKAKLYPLITLVGMVLLSVT